MPVTETSPSFFEAIDLFGRATRASNFLLDNWWLLGLAALAFWLFKKLQSTHALLQELDERCGAAFGDIDAMLAERHALVNNLVEAVKGFSLHEHKVLKDVIDARARAMQSLGQTKLEAEAQIGTSVNSLFAFTENYPEITASPHFQELRGELIHIEEKITAARRFYNLSVEELYGFSRAFPGNLVTGYTKIGEHEKFTLGAKRAEREEPVQISFQPA